MKIKRHSKECPCNENIKVQSEFFGGAIDKLVKSGPKKQTELLKKSSPCFVRYLSHCAGGVLKGHVKLPKKKLKELSSEKKVLLNLVSPKISWRKKRTLFAREQKGGFLRVLSGIASAALSSLIGNQIAKFF